MGALAGEADDMALDAVGPEHDRQGQVEALEHRALLDVQLQVGGRAGELPAGVSRALEVDSVLGQHVGQRRAGGVAQAPEEIRVEALRDGARAEQAAAEAEALLVGPVDEPDRRGRPPVRRQPPQHLETAQHVQAAVEPAPVRDRVEVAADHHGALGGSRERRPEVAGLVGLDAHGQLREPLAVPVPPARPGLGPAHALRAALVAGERLELAQLGDGAGGIERHRGQP